MIKLMGDIDVIRNEFGYIKYRVKVEVDEKCESFEFSKRTEALMFVNKITSEFYNIPGLTISELNKLIENPTKL